MMVGRAVTVGVGVAVVVVASLGLVVGRQRARYAVLVLGGVALVALSAADDPTSALQARDLGLAVGPMAALLGATATLLPRRGVWLAVVGAVLAGPVRALVYDPFLQPTCTDCRPSDVVVAPHPTVAAWLAAAGPVLGLVALWVQALRTRAVAEPAVVAVGLVAALVRTDVGAVLALVAAASVVVVEDHRGAVAQRRLKGLVDTLSSGRPFADVMLQAWGDDDVEVSYWVPEEGGWVTPAGVPRRPPPPGATRLHWAGAVTAAVEHRSRGDLPDLELVLDVPARLTLDNERLSAALAARVRQVSRSRSMVVELGDRERRRIERDLHDGVQQQLLALGLDLRGALADLPPGHPDAAVLESCLEQAKRALEDLRELSHGLYPPLLATSGLGPALRSLARRASVPLVVGSVPDRRLPAAVERAAYAVVSDSVSRGDPGGVAVEVELGAEGAAGAPVGVTEVTVRVAGGPPDLAGVLPDMVEALGGRLGHPDGVLTVVLPCAS
jgi:signal transduction histidine kinase